MNGLDDVYDPDVRTVTIEFKRRVATNQYLIPFTKLFNSWGFTDGLYLVTLKRIDKKDGE